MNRIKLYAVLALAALLLGLPAGAQTKKDADKILHQSEELIRQGEVEQAVVLAAQARDAYERLGLEGSYEYASALWVEAMADQGSGAFAEAEELMDRVAVIMKPLRNKYPTDYFSILNTYAIQLSASGKQQESMKWLEEMDSFFKSLSKPDRKTKVSYLVNYGSGLSLSGHPVEAKPLLEEAVQESRKVFGEYTNEYLEARIALVDCYSSLGLYKENRPLLEELVAEMSRLPEMPPYYSDVIEKLADNELVNGDAASAIRHYRQVDSLVRALYPEIPEYWLNPSLLEAGALLVAGRFQEALTVNERALTLARSLDMEGTYIHLVLLSQRAMIYADSGDEEQSLELGEQVMALGKGDVSCASSIRDIGGLYYQFGRYEEAAACYKEALAVTEGYAEYNLIRIDAIKGLCVCSEQMGKSEEMRQYAEDLLGCYDQFGFLSPDYLSSLVLAFRAEMWCGNHDQAQNLIEKTVASTRAYYGPGSAEYAGSLYGLGVLYSAMNMTSDAVQWLNQSLSVYRAAGEETNEDYRLALTLLVETEKKAGMLSEAVTHLEELTELTARLYGRESQQYRGVLDELMSELIGSQLDVFRVSNLLRDNLPYIEKTCQDNPQELVTWYYAAAMVYQGLGDDARYEYYIQRTNSVLEENPVSSLGDQVAYLLVLYERTPTEAIALRLYELMEDEERWASEPPSTTAMTFARVCSILAGRGEKDKVRECGLRALSMMETHPSPEDMTAKLSIAQSFVNAGFPELAQPVISENAVPVTGRSEIKMQDIAMSSIKFLASHMGDDLDEKEHEAENFASLARSFVRDNFKKMSYREKCEFWANFGLIFMDVYPLLASDSRSASLSKTAYDGLLLGKGILLNSERDLRKAIKTSGDSRSMALYDRIAAERVEWGVLEDGPVKDSLYRVFRRDEDELTRISAEFGDYMSCFTASWEDVRKHLKSKEVAIEFASFESDGDKQYVAFVLGPGFSSPKTINLFNESELRAVSQDKYYRDGSLYELVWAPLADELKGANTVYFSPSGELNSIAIEYVQDKKGVRMNQAMKMFRLSSTREIVRRRTRGRISSAALFGGIDYDAGPEALAESASRVEAEANRKNRTGIRSGDRFVLVGAEDLPGTREEIDAIQSTLESHRIDVRRFDRALAVEEAVKAFSGMAPDILHFATHGFFWDENGPSPGLSSSLLNSSEKAMEEDITMSRTGLLLAGANNTLYGLPIPDSLEDGILTAQEIEGLDLQDTGLVVLAACETGLGQIKGDGVFGLQRGFKKAGVGTIIMSLWKVDDKATQLMMSSFYSALSSGRMTPREALEAAQETVRSQFPDPEYWASFIVLDSR